jgi:type II secretory pathway pseudopilin PulG
MRGIKLRKSVELLVVLVVICLLVAVVIVLAFSALSLVGQMNEAQTKVNALQSQLAYYENVTGSLQTKASSLEAQIYDLQNPIVNATFTDISVGPWVKRGMSDPYRKDINVTYQNVGTTFLGGVTLALKIDGNTTNIDNFLINIKPYHLGVVQVKELQTSQVSFLTGWEDRKQALSECNLTITLMLDKLTLDSQTVIIGR